MRTGWPLRTNWAAAQVHSQDPQLLVFDTSKIILILLMIIKKIIIIITSRIIINRTINMTLMIIITVPTGSSSMEQWSSCSMLIFDIGWSNRIEILTLEPKVLQREKMRRHAVVALDTSWNPVLLSFLSTFTWGLELPCIITIYLSCVWLICILSLSVD